MRKIDIITELYARTLKELTSSRRSWLDFLKTAAFQYKYPFQDQVLIHAQRPGATACAEIEMWNEHFGRWVNKGSHGIALIRDKGGRAGLTYVFDVRDTHHRDDRPFRLWELKPEMNREVMTALENRFGDLEMKNTFLDAVVSATNNICEDNLTDYLYNLTQSVYGSRLDGYDEGALRDKLLPLMKGSVAYSVITRLGYRADECLDMESYFSALREFNTADTVNLLGSATADLSEISLREIERTVRAYEKNRKFAEKENVRYNDGEKENNTIQGGKDHGRNDSELQGTGRGNDTRPEAPRADGLSAWEVRTDETQVSEGAPQGNLHNSVDTGEAERASSRSGGNSESTDLGDYKPTGEEPWGNGADEVGEPNAVGTADERDQDVGRGRSAEQPDLRITQNSDELPPISDADNLIQILRHGDYLAHSKEEIVSFLLSEKDEAKKAEYIKGCYPQNFYGEMYKAGTKEHIGYHAESNGLALYVGNYLTRTEESKFSWDLTAKLIEALIKDKNYLDVSAEKPKSKTTQKPSSPEGQITLFDDSAVYETISGSTAPLPQPTTNRLAVPQATIDEFIRLGGCTKGSTERIYGYYRRANDTAENIAFLRSEYDTDQIGLVIDGRKAAASWDENGVVIAEGDKTVGAWRSVSLSWEDIDKRTRELIELGQYIPKHQADKADEVYEDSLANDISFIYRDYVREIPDENKTVPDRYIWPEAAKFYRDILHDRERLSAFCDQLESNVALMENKDGYFYKRTCRLLFQARAFLRDPVSFKEADENILPRLQYITEDGINHVICSGSSVSDNKLRTYSFFLRNKETDKRTRYIQDEYGTGGGGWRHYTSHDGKGLVISRNMVMDNGSKILLKWSDVAKRIDALIRKDKYLNEADKAELEGYEKRQIARAIGNFYTDLIDVPKPYALDKGEAYWDADKYILPQLEEPDRVKEILAMMQSTFDSLMPGERNYEWRKDRLDTVKSFVNGTFDLFPGSHFRKKEQSKDVIPPEEKQRTEQVELAKDVDLSESGYDIHLGTWVHIGKDEVQIQAVTEKGVELFDGTMFPMELPLDVFYRRLKDNPLNDHLKMPETVDHTPKTEYKDVFYVHPKEDLIVWIYYNPDSNAEGQYVCNYLTFENIASAMVNRNDADDFFDALEGYAEQSLVDVGTPDFDRVDNDFKNKTATFTDCTEATMNELIAAYERDAEEQRLLAEAKELISDYLDREFGEKPDFEKHDEIGLAYTTVGDADHTIDVSADIAEYSVTVRIDNRIYEERKYDKLSEFIDKELKKLDFDDLTSPNGLDDYLESLDRGENEEDDKLRYVGRIDFLGTDGTVGETMEFVDEEAFKAYIQKENYSGVPMNIVVYCNPYTGEHIDYKWFTELDPPPKGFSIVGNPYVIEAEKNRSEQGDFIPGIEKITPIEQYDRLKNAYRNSIAAIRVGDFYEFYDDDAEIVAKALDITLTSCPFPDGTRHPMCGIPFHKENEYFGKLNDAGYSVAQCDDDGEPVILNIPRTVRENNELDAIARFLHAEKIDDIQVRFNDGVFSATDGETTWNRREFYDFLLHDVVTLNPDGTLPDGYGSITEDILQPIKEFAHEEELKALTMEDNARFELHEYSAPSQNDQYAIYDNTIGGYYVDDDNLIHAYDTEAEAFLYLEDVIQREKSISNDRFDKMPTMQESEKPKQKKASFKYLPEIIDRTDHRIKAEDLPLRTASDKYERNIRAIRTLLKIEDENRLATPSEQKLLADYSGWGGLADCFDDNSPHYDEMRTVMMPDEFVAARESTLTAFYTPPVIIEAVYKALENMGFRRGNILEPSCGVGNFIGLLPDSMNDSMVYGVELDSLSGRMARQLYQNHSITIGGFEETAFPDSFFDVAVGNVPFGQFKVLNKKYDKYNFLIHDYFFAKALDKVRPGGVIAFITSKGTLDKENPAVRKYIAQRADLIGAIRLPDNAFKSAGTDVVADIIFLQKRDRIMDIEPDWVHLGKDENGIAMNQYFIDNPDMILGETVMRSGPFGPEPTCKAYDGVDLGELLDDAVHNIHAEIVEQEASELEETDSIPADPTVKNFSYTLIDGKVYFRQNSVMNKVETTVTGENRIKGLITLRDTVRALIDAQLEDAPDSEITALQEKLNTDYDAFVVKYGLINSRGNESVFSDDSSYFLLSSLEILNEDKQLERKADMFYKRTIKPYVKIEKVDTASEALAVSLSERACIDMEFMSELTGKTEDEIYTELKGVIFLNPEESVLNRQPKYLTADEYLSGNVREKLARARKMLENDFAEYAVNVEALEDVQPQDLSAAEIGVKLGSTWVPDDVVQDFVFQLLETPSWVKWNMKVKYIPATAQWVITDKSRDRGSVKSSSVYGTKRMDAYSIIEETLNLKDVRIFDYVEDENGNKKPVLNKKETMIAQGKQEQIKRAFEEWIWKDPVRRDRLCTLYNEKFNSTRPREYDGSHIKYYGMNPEIKLRKHQTDAVARIMYGGNSLLAHVVGAGKTFTIVAAAQESKRLGLCSKSMIVVPNHLIEQWASEYLQLYPSANILVATKKDFETKNRKKFCARIATGDYDAVIIGHSQFEKIPVSVERQMRTLQAEIDELTEGIAKLKYERGERVTVKQLEKSRKQLETRLAKLNDQSRKDDVVCFEELGIDRLFVDEAHSFKNLFLYTKMRNVAGIAQTEAQKSSDLYMKCRYMDEITGGKGVIFATGTPISNSMTELYTMQRYLQYDELKERGLSAFDSWASTFGETVTAIELAPEGYNLCITKVNSSKF